MRSLFWATLLWPVYFFSPFASAWNCTTETPNTTIAPPAPSIAIPHNLPVGSEIGTQVMTDEIAAFRCWNSDEGVLQNQRFGVQALGVYVTNINGRHVYKTNIAGVGYAIGGVDTSDCRASGWVSGTNTMYQRSESYSLCYNPNGPIGSFLPKGKVMMIYYKIANETGSGTVQGQVVGALVLQTNTVLNHPVDAKVTSTPFNITTLGCTVNKPAIPVPIGEVPKNAFKGPGTTADDSFTRNFDIPLTCHAGTKVTMTIDGSVKDADNGVLNISGSGDDIAKGVGIQVLYKNSPLQFGTEILTGTATNAGSYDIPLKARYFQTESKMSGGKANGVATFVMKYD